MKLIDADNFKSVIENVFDDPKLVEKISYYLDAEEEVDIIDSFDVIPAEWIHKWGFKANRSYHIALLIADWHEERKKMGYVEF